MSFIEVRFPDDISYGSSFGPGWQTDVVRISSGHERRNQKWSESVYRGDVAYGVKSKQQMLNMISFFQEMRGRKHGFRFKDWQDFEAVDEPLSPDGSPTVQLTKRYGAGFNDFIRVITKPVDGAVTLKRGGVDYGTFTLDATTGVITLTEDSNAVISDIAQDAQGTVTALSHGFSTGDSIYIDGVVGMTEVNGAVYVITVVDPDTFTIGTDTTGFSAYSSGGLAYHYIQPGEDLTWTGEFDVPVRFDTDEVSATYDTYDNLSASVPIIEIRV